MEWSSRSTIDWKRSKNRSRRKKNREIKDFPTTFNTSRRIFIFQFHDLPLLKSLTWADFFFFFFSGYTSFIFASSFLRWFLMEWMNFFLSFSFYSSRWRLLKGLTLHIFFFFLLSMVEDFMCLIWDPGRLSKIGRSGV